MERRFDGRGRIVLRASGTEPVIRVMVEGYDAALVKNGAREIAAGSRRCGGRPDRGRNAQVRSEGLQLPGRAANLRRLSRQGKCPKVWLCVVRWSRVIGKCTDRGPPIEALLAELEQRLKPEWPIDVVVFPPYVYLADAVRMLEEGDIAVGAQDVCAEPGVHSPVRSRAAMLKDVGCSYVIVGHSERRRWYHEDDALVARKFARGAAGRSHADAVRRGNPGGARGESHRGGGGSPARGGDRDERRRRASAQAILAYEPVWAIGTGRTASPEQAQAVHAYLRGRIARARC